MTTVVAADSPHAAKTATASVRWLKRYTSDNVHQGVVGRDVKTQAEAAYRDVYYTDEALNELSRGTIWKQNETDHIVFLPLTVQVAGPSHDPPTSAVARPVTTRAKG